MCVAEGKGERERPRALCVVLAGPYKATLKNPQELKMRSSVSGRLRKTDTSHPSRSPVTEGEKEILAHSIAARSFVKQHSDSGNPFVRQRHPHPKPPPLLLLLLLVLLGTPEGALRRVVVKRAAPAVQ